MSVLHSVLGLKGFPLFWYGEFGFVITGELTHYGVWVVLFPR